MTIVEFLEARIAEDEVVARVCADADHEGPELRVRIVSGEGMYVFGPHEVAPSGRFGYEEDERTRHFERHDPARVLREVAAKRAIVDRFKSAPMAFYEDDGGVLVEYVLGEVLTDLARIYSDHPDFNPDWAE